MKPNCDFDSLKLRVPEFDTVLEEIEESKDRDMMVKRTRLEDDSNSLVHID